MSKQYKGEIRYDVLLDKYKKAQEDLDKLSQDKQVNIEVNLKNSKGVGKDINKISEVANEAKTNIDDLNKSVLKLNNPKNTKFKNNDSILLGKDYINNLKKESTRNVAEIKDYYSSMANAHVSGRLLYQKQVTSSGNNVIKNATDAKKQNAITKQEISDLETSIKLNNKKEQLEKQFYDTVAKSNKRKISNRSMARKKFDFSEYGSFELENLIQSVGAKQGELAAILSDTKENSKAYNAIAREMWNISLGLEVAQEAVQQAKEKEKQLEKTIASNTSQSSDTKSKSSKKDTTVKNAIEQAKEDGKDLTKLIGLMEKNGEKLKKFEFFEQQERYGTKVRDYGDTSALDIRSSLYEQGRNDQSLKQLISEANKIYTEKQKGSDVETYSKETLRKIGAMKKLKSTIISELKDLNIEVPSDITGSNLYKVAKKVIDGETKDIESYIASLDNSVNISKKAETSVKNSKKKDTSKKLLDEDTKSKQSETKSLEENTKSTKKNNNAKKKNNNEKKLTPQELYELKNKKTITDVKKDTDNQKELKKAIQDNNKAKDSVDKEITKGKKKSNKKHTSTTIEIPNISDEIKKEADEIKEANSRIKSLTTEFNKNLTSYFTNLKSYKKNLDKGLSPENNTATAGLLTNIEEAIKRDADIISEVVSLENKYGNKITTDFFDGAYTKIRTQIGKNPTLLEDVRLLEDTIKAEKETQDKHTKNSEEYNKNQKRLNDELEEEHRKKQEFFNKIKDETTGDHREKTYQDGGVPLAIEDFKVLGFQVEKTNSKLDAFGRKLSTVYTVRTGDLETLKFMEQFDPITGNVVDSGLLSSQEDYSKIVKQLVSARITLQKEIYSTNNLLNDYLIKGFSRDTSQVKDLEERLALYNTMPDKIAETAKSIGKLDLYSKEADRALMSVDSKHEISSLANMLRDFDKLTKQFEKQSGRLDSAISAKGSAISKGVVENLQATRDTVEALIKDILNSKVVLTPDKLIEISNSTSNIKSDLNGAILDANKVLADRFSKDDSQKVSGIKSDLDTLETKILRLNNALLTLKNSWGGYLNQGQLDNVATEIAKMESVYDTQFELFSDKDKIIDDALKQGKEIGEATREGFNHVFTNIDREAIKQSSRTQQYVAGLITEARITAQKSQSEAKGDFKLTGLIDEISELSKNAFVAEDAMSGLLSMVDEIGKSNGTKKQTDLMNNLAAAIGKAGEEAKKAEKAYNDNIEKGLSIDGARNKIDSLLLGISDDNKVRLKKDINEINDMFKKLDGLEGDAFDQQLTAISNSLKRLGINNKELENNISYLKETKKQLDSNTLAITKLKDKASDLRKEISDNKSNISKNLGEDSLKELDNNLSKIEQKLGTMEYLNSKQQLKVDGSSFKTLEHTVKRLGVDFSNLVKESNNVGKNVSGLDRLNSRLDDIKSSLNDINKKGIVDKSQVEEANNIVATLSSRIESLNSKAKIDLNDEEIESVSDELDNVVKLISQVNKTSKDMKFELDVDDKLEKARESLERFSAGVGANYSGLKELQGFINSISSMPIDLKPGAIKAFNDELRITEDNLNAIATARRNLSTAETNYKGFINTSEVDNIRKSIEQLSNLNTSKTAGEIDKISASITRLGDEGKRLKLEDSSFTKTEASINKARNSLDNYAKSLAEVRRNLLNQSDDIFNLFNMNEVADAKNIINSISDSISELQSKSDGELLNINTQEFEKIKSGVDAVKKSVSDMVNTARKELNSMNKFFDMDNSFKKFLNKNQKVLDAKDVNIVKNLKAAFDEIGKATSFESMSQKLKEFQQALNATGIEAKELADNLTKNLNVTSMGLDLEKQIGRMSGIQGKYGSFVNVEEMQRAMMLASEFKKYLSDMDNFSNAEAKAKLKELTNAIQEVENGAKKASKEMKISDGVKKMADDIENLRREGKITSQQADELYKSLSKINGLSTDQAESELRSLRSQMGQMAKDTKFLNKSFGKEFFSDLYFNLRTFQLGRLIGDGIRRAMYQVKEIIMSMDDAMREVRKVADAEYVDSPLKLDMIQKDAIAISKTLGVASNDFLTSLSTTLKLGFSDMQQATEIARNTMMLANVGDISPDEASQAVATLVNAWNLDTVREYRKEVDGVTQSYTQFTEAIDLVNYIGNTRPIDTAGVLDAMKASSNVAKQFGMNMYELSGFIASANSTIQDANKVGTGMRALILRMSGADYDESEGDTSYNKIGKTVKDLAGIDIFSEDKKSLKSMTVVFEELATKWSSFDDATQKTLAKVIGGQRQSETFLAIMNNYDMAKDIVAELNQGLHLGSASKENEQFIDSISGKLAQLKNTWTEVITSIFESETIKGFIDMANTALEAVARVVNALKDMNLALPATIATLMGASGMLKFLADKGLGFALSSVIGKLAKGGVGTGIGEAAEELAEGMTRTSASSSLAFAGLMKFRAAIPILLGVGAAIYTIYKNLEKANKVKAEELDVSVSNRKSTVKSLKDESKKVTELSRRYKELASKKELTKDEQKEFVAIKDDILAVSPDSVSFDAEGNISSINISNLDSLRDKLKTELEREEFVLDAEINARFNLAENDSTGENKAIKFTKEWFENEIGWTAPQRLQELQRKYDAIIGDGAKYNAKQGLGLTIQRMLGGSGYIASLLKYGRLLPEVSNGTSEAIDNILKSGNYSQKNIKKLNELQQKELTTFKNISEELLGEVNTNAENAVAYQSKIANDLSKTSWFEGLDDFNRGKVASIIDSMSNINNFPSGAIRSDFLNTLFKGFEDGNVDMLVFETSLKEINDAFSNTGDIEAYNKELTNLGKITANQMGKTNGTTGYTDFVNSFFHAFKTPFVAEEYGKLTDHISKIEKESENYISKIEDSLKFGNKKTISISELDYVIESSESSDKIKDVAREIRNKLQEEGREFTTLEENNLLFTYMYNWTVEDANIESTLSEKLGVEELELYVNEINRLQDALNNGGDETIATELEKNIDSLSRKTGLEKEALKEYMDLINTADIASGKRKGSYFDYSGEGSKLDRKYKDKYQFEDKSADLINIQFKDLSEAIKNAPTEKLKQWENGLLAIGYASKTSSKDIDSVKDALATSISEAVDINKDIVLEGINLKLDEKKSGIDLSYSIDNMIKKVTSKNNGTVNLEVQAELKELALNDSTPDIIKKQIEMALTDNKVTVLELEGILDLSMKVNAGLDTSEYDKQQKEFFDELANDNKKQEELFKKKQKRLYDSQKEEDSKTNKAELSRQKQQELSYKRQQKALYDSQKEEDKLREEAERKRENAESLYRKQQKRIYDSQKEDDRLAEESEKNRKKVENLYKVLSENPYGSLLTPTLENAKKDLPKELSDMIETILSNDEFSKEEYDLLLDVTAKIKNGEDLNISEIKKQLDDLNNYAGKGTGLTIDVEGNITDIDTGTEKPVIDVLLSGTITEIKNNASEVLNASNQNNSDIFKYDNLGINSNGVLTAEQYVSDLNKKKKAYEDLKASLEKNGGNTEWVSGQLEEINKELGKDTIKKQVEAEKSERESYNDVLRQSADAYKAIEDAKTNGTWDTMSTEQQDALNSSLESALTNLQYLQSKYGSGLEIEIEGKVTSVSIDSSVEDLTTIKGKLEIEKNNIETKLESTVEGSEEAKTLETTLTNIETNLSTVNALISIKTEFDEESEEYKKLQELLSGDGEEEATKDINVNTKPAETAINNLVAKWNDAEFEEKTLPVTSSDDNTGKKGLFGGLFGGGKKETTVDVKPNPSSFTETQNAIDGLKQTTPPPINVDSAPANTSVGAVKTSWDLWNPVVKQLKYNITETKTIITNTQGGAMSVSENSGSPVGDGTMPISSGEQTDSIQPRTPSTDGSVEGGSDRPTTFASGWTTPVRVHNKSVDYLVYGINLTTELENKIKGLANQLDLLEAKMEHAFGKKKINYMKEQIRLLEKQKQIQKDLIKQLETEQSKLKSFLSSNGFKFDAEGGVTNYVAKLMEMNKKLDSIKNEKEYEKYKNNLDELTKALERYLDITFSDLPDAIVGWEDLENQIKDVYKEQLEIAKETEEKLMEIYKKQIDDHKEMLEKQTEDTIKALEKRVKAEVDAINEVQKAYNKARDEEDYQEELADKREALAKIEKQIALASRDNSTAGKAKLEKLMEEYDNLKDDLDDFLQDREDKLVNDLFDDEKDRLEKESQDEIERLEKELEDALKKLEETYTEEKLMEMIKDALATGKFTGIDGSVSDLNEVMLQFLNSTSEGLGATGQIIKNEWIGNLEIAKDVLKDIDNIVKELELDKFHNNNDMFKPDTFSVTPQQSRTIIPQDMNVQRFIDGISSASGKTVNFNQPLIQIDGNVTEDVMPRLEKFAKEVEKRITNNIVYAMR